MAEAYNLLANLTRKMVTVKNRDYFTAMFWFRINTHLNNTKFLDLKNIVKTKTT